MVMQKCRSKKKRDLWVFSCCNMRFEKKLILFQSFEYSFLSNTSNVLNKSNIGPQGQKLINITHLISITVDQFSFLNQKLHI